MVYGYQIVARYPIGPEFLDLMISSGHARFAFFLHFLIIRAAHNPQEIRHLISL